MWQLEQETFVFLSIWWVIGFSPEVWIGFLGSS
jgi:hypothetical protein